MSAPTKIVIFGAEGSPESGPTDAPKVRANPILTDQFGVAYTRIVADTDVPGTPLALVPYVTTGVANLYGLPAVTYPMLFSGPANNNLFQQKGATAENFDPNPDTGIGAGVVMTAGRGEWGLTHAPAVATRATISRAAVVGARHICSSISAVFCCAPADTATTALLHLRDGATGAGTILRSWRFAEFNTTAGGKFQVEIAGLHLTGSINTAMTLEFAAAPGAASFQSVGIGGYSVNES